MALSNTLKLRVLQSLIIILLVSCSSIDRTYYPLDNLESREKGLICSGINNFSHSKGSNKISLLLGNGKRSIFFGPVFLPIIPNVFGRQAWMPLKISLESENRLDQDSILKSIRFFYDDSVEFTPTPMSINNGMRSSGEKGALIVCDIKYELEVNYPKKIAILFNNEIKDTYGINCQKLEFSSDYSTEYVPFIFSGH